MKATGSIYRFDSCGKTSEQQRRQTSLPFRRGALASEATFLTPAHQPKTEKKRERKRQRADRAGVGEKSQRRVADYPLHRLSNQPVFQTEIPPTASVQRTDRAKKESTTFVEVARGSRRAQRSEHTERHTCHFGGSRAFVPSRREAQLRSRKIRKEPIMTARRLRRPRWG